MDEGKKACEFEADIDFLEGVRGGELEADITDRAERRPEPMRRALEDVTSAVNSTAVVQ